MVQMWRSYLSGCCLFIFLLISSGCSQSPKITNSVEPWIEADLLFHKGSRWLGGDGAYSVDLGNGRILWLFGDSFICLNDSKLRSESWMVRNSVAIQDGYDPSSASIRFYWSEEKEFPESFFSSPDSIWYWPGHGICLHEKLLIFLMKLRPSDKGLFFEIAGWTAIKIDNPDEEPDQWDVKFLDTPQNEFNVIVGSASILHMNDTITALSIDWSKGHNAYLVRWPVADVLQGNLMKPQWWTGETSGWVVQDALPGKPHPIFSNAQVECTIHYEPVHKRYIQIQAEDFGATNIALRWADRLEGPWTPLKKFYRPEESDRSDVIMYACKAHPQLHGADLIVTYVTNSAKGIQWLIGDTSLYYPRFVKVQLK